MGIKDMQQRSAGCGKPRPAFLKVNKYESADMALNLIAHICTKDEDVFDEDCFKPFYDHIKRIDLPAVAKEACRKVCADLSEEMDMTNGRFSQTIAVCGGYSSGKSTFLNCLLETSDALPTGINPVSMVNTYISCSEDVNQLSVMGRNFKGNLVGLNREVLDCIQHSSKTKVYVTSILNTLYINLPFPEGRDYLRGLTFVDTPGYDNSDDKNEENNRTDKETAEEAMRNADAVIWCVNMLKGTITDSDLEMLKTSIADENIPFIIVFTRMNQKPDDEVQKILEEAHQLCKVNLGREALDVVGFSVEIDGYDFRTLRSIRGEETENEASAIMRATFERLKASMSSRQCNVESYCQIIRDIFNNEILICVKEIDDLEEHRHELADAQHSDFWQVEESKKEVREYMPALQEFMLNHYDTLVENYHKLFSEMERVCKDGFEREEKWMHEAWFFNNTNYLQKRQSRSEGDAEALKTDYETLSRSEWEEGKRKKLYDWVGQCVQNQKKESDRRTKDLKSAYEKVVEDRKQKESHKSELVYAEDESTQLLSNCANNAKMEIKKRMKRMLMVEEAHDTNVFKAIAVDNYSQFLECFSVSKGVDVNECNAEGFSPVTYAARLSNNSMVQFFIDHGVDFEQKDKNGRNALETAAYYHCQDICDMLIKHDPNLINKSSSLAGLADNSEFKDWISKF